MSDELDEHEPTWGDLVREVFPDVDDAVADIILWEHTGFPSFWKEDPVAECRAQLRSYKAEILGKKSQDRKGKKA